MDWVASGAVFRILTFSRLTDQRPIPFIFSTEQISRLVEEAFRLPPVGSLRPQTYGTLFALLASTGMRISEALALEIADIQTDGLLIRDSKFRKSRLVPLHESVQAGVESYLKRRSAVIGTRIFVTPDGRPLPYSTINKVYPKLIRKIGITTEPGKPRPRLHCLRHTFAVRSLEACPGDRNKIAEHQVALATYLGHADSRATYWYLQSTSSLLRDIADVCETTAAGGPL